MMVPPNAGSTDVVVLPTAPPPPKRSNRPHTYIGKLILEMKKCLTELDAKNVTFPQLEAMAVSIHESMSNSSRNYHSVQHVFDISRDLTDPISILSAFFHDCIYYHVDGGLTKDQAKLLKGIYQENPDGSHTFLTSTEDSDDTLVQMVECVFGFAPGQKVTAGLNEFLSAIIAVRELECNLPMRQLAQIACCIECTIPFRAVDKETGESATEKLFKKMQVTNEKFNLGMDEDELVKSVQRACILSNNDVGNFGSKDLHWFLDNTWSLLPETNETLRQQYLYTVKEFHLGIFKTNGFFVHFIRAEVVFQSFRGVPNERYMDAIREQCRRNLIVGTKYVGAKLLAMSVLAAFAELTGGDAPMSLFMGDLPSRHHRSTTIEEFLPCIPPEELDHVDRDVYELLAVGRRAETSFDIRQSPLAAYLYGRLGDEGLTKALGVTKLHPMEQDNAIEFLSALPRDVVEIIAQNLKMVALSRAELIQAVLDKLPAPAEAIKAE